MGRWGTGIFDADGTLDFLTPEFENLVFRLYELVYRAVDPKVRESAREQYGGVAIPALGAMVLAIAKACPHDAYPAEEIGRWRRALNSHDELKVDGWEQLEAVFDGLEGAAADWEVRADSAEDDYERTFRIHYEHWCRKKGRMPVFTPKPPELDS